MLDLLKAHKWIYIKLATDDSFRAVLKQKNSITVAGVVMHLELVSGRGGSLVAKHFTRDLEKALEVADKLKAAGLRPNIVKSGPDYVVYIATADLLKACRGRRHSQKGHSAASRRKGQKRHAETEKNRRKDSEEEPLFSSTFLHP